MQAAGPPRGANRQEQSRPQHALFRGALASKFTIGFSLISYIYVTNKGTTEFFKFDSTNINKNGLILRYFTSKITFLTPGEAIMGTSLLFFLMRKYEREMGTRKFVLFWIIVQVLTVVQEFTFLQGLSIRNSLDYPSTGGVVYSGPYCVLAALFTLYHMYAPRIHPRFVSVLGFHFSEKTFYYVWYAQLALSGGWSALLPIGAGTIASIIFTRTPLGSFSVPDSVVRFLQPILQHIAPPPALPTAPPVRRAAPPVRHNPVQRVPPEAEIPVPEPDADAVEQLTNMGFPRQQVMEALRQSHNNVEHAANRLLGGT